MKLIDVLCLERKKFTLIKRFMSFFFQSENCMEKWTFDLGNGIIQWERYLWLSMPMKNSFFVIITFRDNFTILTDFRFWASPSKSFSTRCHLRSRFQSFLLNFKQKYSNLGKSLIFFIKTMFWPRPQTYFQSAHF